jgi:putative spermidine/putrescine transport system permease protein
MATLASPAGGRRLRFPAAKIGAAIGLLAILLVLLAPQIVVIGAAFTETRYMTFPPQGFTTEWFGRMLDYRPFMPALQTSLQAAAGATLVALVLGTMAALAVARHRFPGRAFLNLFFLSPLVLPTIIIAFSVFEFMRATEQAYTLRGIILAHVVITFPYVFRSVLVSVQAVDRSLEEAAASLRANPWQVFMKVTLPAIRPGLLAGSIFAFIVSFDDLIVSLFLTGPRIKTLPVVMYAYTTDGLDPVIAAISTTLIVAASILVLVLEKTFGFSRLV